MSNIPVREINALMFIGEVMMMAGERGINIGSLMDGLSVFSGSRLISAARLAELEAAERDLKSGEWVSAGDRSENLRALDVALNGKDGAAHRPALTDILSQVAAAERLVGRPLMKWISERLDEKYDYEGALNERNHARQDSDLDRKRINAFINAFLTNDGPFLAAMQGVMGDARNPSLEEVICAIDHAIAARG